MPRDGSGSYSLPAGTQVVTGTPISSTKYNAFVEDVEQDLNTARPISAGGTGATTAAGVRDSLDIDNKVVSKSSNYTAVASDRSKVIPFTATATLTLNAAATLGDGWYIKVPISGGDVTITAAENINGSSSDLVASDGETLTIHCDGTNFTTTAVSANTLPSNTVWANLTGSAAKPTGSTMAALGAALANSAGPFDTTSGDEVVLSTAIPSGVNWVDIIFNNVGLNNDNDVIVQISTSATFVTTGYASTSIGIKSDTGTSEGDGNDSGFLFFLNSSGARIQGRMRLTREPGTDVWIEDHTGKKGVSGISGGGRLDLGGTLDGLRIRATGAGGQEFDEGKVSARWGY